MTRDVRNRLRQFSRNITEVERLALNFDQVEEWQPPENPAKTTDSRYAAYVDLYGESSWELDAVDPATLGNLVETAIQKLRNEKLYLSALEREKKMRRELENFAKKF